MSPMTDHRQPVVALVTDAVYPYHRGGKELRYFELARRLTRYADVHVYTMNWWKGPRVRADDQVTYHGISPLFPLYKKGRRSIGEALLFSLACLQMLVRRFDVIEADHMPYFQIFALRLVATIKRRRLVVTWHEVWSRPYWRQYLGPLGVIAWYVERLAMAMPDRIIAASPQTAEALREALGPRAAIIAAPNGIDLDAVRAAYPDAETTDIVVVGRLMSHKRIDMLLEAVALLHADGMPVTCRVIGDGPERENLHALAQSLNVAHAVEFRHDVGEQKEVYSLLKAARVSVFPSAREGFGIAVLEALACGVPVVTTSAPANQARHLVTRSSQGTVCAASPAAIAQAVKAWLITDPGQPDSHRARRDDDWLTEYSWEAITGRVAAALLS
jgi:glycosyltransferase involved in cell wall biosynthesis